MVYISLGVVRCQIKTQNRELAEKLLHSLALSAESIKNTLSQVVKEGGIVDAIKFDKWVLKLDAIPVTLFDTQFKQRLAQAVRERLAQEQASIGDHHAVKLTLSETTESSLLLNELHCDDKGLFQFALGCLKPLTLKALLFETPANQLKQWLKRLLNGAWQSPKKLPVVWYDRVTASRLSIAAVLYLLKSQQGHDWLMSQHSPTVSQVTDWAKAIAQGEIPPEQLAQLLAGNRPAHSASPGQPACSPLVVMRWLLPLWRQPAVRQVIHRLEGGRGVQQVDAYLCRCLQSQDDDALREKIRIHTDPDQGARARANDTLPKDKGIHTEPQQVALAPDYATLPERKKMLTTSRYVIQPGKGGLGSTNEPLSSSQGISNAGLLLLWPLLPQLFSQLSLWEQQQFISDVARWQAVLCLDRLVWGEASPMDERLTLNQLLCGVSLSPPLPPTAPLSLLQQQQIDDWLTAIGQQLAGWQKLSLTDIRQLFLQRAGEISTVGAFPQISVRPEPYDLMLRNWPWPMTLASFPWTEQPLTIVWPLKGLTG